MLGDPRFIDLEEDQVLNGIYSLWLFRSFVYDVKQKKSLDK